MSRPPLAGCLVLCLLTLAPAASTRAEDGGSSPRRKAEIDALIARRRTEKQKRARVAASRDAEMARRLSEARAYEVNLAQALATYQMSLERQATMQRNWLDRATRSTSPQTVYLLSPDTAGPGIPAYTSGPVFVNFNPPRPASEACPRVSRPFRWHGPGRAHRSRRPSRPDLRALTATPADPTPGGTPDLFRPRAGFSADRSGRPPFAGFDRDVVGPHRAS